jgi:hypothetical protein
VADFDALSPRGREVLDAQGWTEMVGDHCPTVEEIVREFYANLLQRRGDSFLTWIRGKEIEVSPTLISNITRAPR